jgi:predicted ATPase
LFPGTFQEYVASIIFQWKESKDDRIKVLAEYMFRLGLTWKIDVDRPNDTSIEIKVGRTRKSYRGGAKDLVNISDVGFGVSQTLPVLVALLTAQPGQIVYLEEPEIHLHPSAQVSLAEILVENARRGVILVVETHSSLILKRIQSLVVDGVIDENLVGLNWFSRDSEEGFTDIITAELDENGAYGDWPVDFADVELDAEKQYLDAVDRKMFHKK